MWVNVLLASAVLYSFCPLAITDRATRPSRGCGLIKSPRADFRATLGRPSANAKPQNTSLARTFLVHTPDPVEAISHRITGDMTHIPPGKAIFLTTLDVEASALD